MNKAPAFDLTFVSYALTAIFGDDVLAKKSTGNRRSSFNDLTFTHLDQDKLDFVYGTVLLIYYDHVCFIPFDVDGFIIFNFRFVH